MNFHRARVRKITFRNENRSESAVMIIFRILGFGKREILGIHFK